MRRTASGDEIFTPSGIERIHRAIKFHDDLLAEVANELRRKAKRGNDGCAALEIAGWVIQGNPDKPLTLQVFRKSAARN